MSPRARVAYFVQSHRQPEQVLRLLTRLRRDSPEAVLVSGHCSQAPPLDERRLAELGVFAFRHRRQGRRSYWSVLEPYLDAIALLADCGLDYEWLVYLSGADYPLQPLAVSEGGLAASGYDAYLAWQDLEQPGPGGRRHQSKRRYLYQYRDLPRLLPLLRLLRRLNGVQSLWHVHLHYGPRLGIRSRPPRGWQIYRGVVWSTLRRRAAERVAAAAREEGELVAYLQRTSSPEEAFLQTVLVGDGRFRICNDSSRFADYRNSTDGHPRTLGMADAAALRASGLPFGRRFDPEVDEEILDWLDRQAS
jgi:hypothetical protein